MKMLFFAGWGLLLIAFATASAEVLARSITGATYLLVPALELWYTLSPGSLSIVQIRMENLIPILWDPVLISIMVLPAWAIFGIPGCIMIALFRPRKSTDWRDIEEARKHEDSLNLYDELTKDAIAQGMIDETDGQLPDHSVLDALEDLNRRTDPADIYFPEDAEEDAVVDQLDDDEQARFDSFIREAGIEPRHRPPNPKD